MWMWLGLSLLPGISPKLRRPFSDIGASGQSAVISKQVAMKR